MDKIIEAARRYADVEWARIGGESRQKLESMVADQTKRNMLRSGATLEREAEIRAEAIEAHADATWRALRDILEASSKSYYRSKEVEAVKQYLSNRFGRLPKSAVQALELTARRVGLSNLDLSDLERRLEAAQSKAKTKLLAEADKFFASRQSFSPPINPPPLAA